MNPYVTLDDAKKQLNIDSYFTDDDTYIEQLTDIAVEVVQRHSRVDFEEEGCPKALKHAILLLVGTWYLDRESVTAAAMKPVPHSYDYLVDMYYKYDNWG